MHQLGKYMEIGVAEYLRNHLRKSTLEVEALRTYTNFV